MSLMVNGTTIYDKKPKVYFNGSAVNKVVMNGTTVYALPTKTTTGTAYSLLSYTSSALSPKSAWTNVTRRYFRGQDGSGLSIRTLCHSAYDSSWETEPNSYSRVLHNGTEIAYKYTDYTSWQYSGFVNRTVNYGNYFDLQYHGGYSYKTTYVGMQIYSNTNASSVITTS